MKSFYFVLSLVIGGLVQYASADESSASGVRVVNQTEGILIQEDDRPVLFYQRSPKSLEGKYTRAHYVHPLYDLDGQVITEDFPRDHPHQRGVYWAWHQVWVGEERMGDPWALKDFAWNVEPPEIMESRPDSAAIHARALWTSPRRLDTDGLPKPFVEDTAIIRVHRQANDIRKIDFEIRLRALVDGVRIGGSEDVKGYGGFSIRMRVPRGTHFFGRGGEVAPRSGAVEAGPWVDIVSPVVDANRSIGLAVLCHPTLPGFPQPWVLRRGGSMQNPVYPGRETVALPRDNPLILRYRLVVHRGDSDTAGIDALQKQYAEK